MGSSTTLTAQVRLTVSDFQGRDVISDTRVGVLLGGVPVSKRSLTISAPVSLGPVQKFVSVMGDGDFTLRLVKGQQVIDMRCSKMFFTYSAFDDVIVGPITPAPDVPVSLRIASS